MSRLCIVGVMCVMMNVGMNDADFLDFFSRNLMFQNSPPCQQAPARFETSAVLSVIEIEIIYIQCSDAKGLNEIIAIHGSVYCNG